MDKTFRIVKLAYHVLVPLYVLLFALTVFHVTDGVVFDIAVIIGGLMAIIFRKEVVFLLREKRNEFKRRHPRLGKYHNPLITEWFVVLVAAIVVMVCLLDVIRNE